MASLYLAGRAMDTLGIATTGATAVVQGYGNVGAIAAHSEPSGLPDPRRQRCERRVVPPARPRHAAVGRLGPIPRDLGGLSGSGSDRHGDPLELSCDVLVPAALERQITGPTRDGSDAEFLQKERMVPTTPDADAISTTGETCSSFRDILCNAGGVVVSYFEWVQGPPVLFWTEGEVMDRLFRIPGRRLHPDASIVTTRRDLCGPLP